MTYEKSGLFHHILPFCDAQIYHMKLWVLFFPDFECCITVKVSFLLLKSTLLIMIYQKKFHYFLFFLWIVIETLYSLYWSCFSSCSVCVFSLYSKCGDSPNANVRIKQHTNTDTHTHPEVHESLSETVDIQSVMFWYWVAPAE